MMKNMMDSLHFSYARNFIHLDEAWYSSSVTGEELPTLKLKELEHMAIVQAMRMAHGSVTRAARLLGIGRATLYRRLAEMNLPPDSAQQPS